MVHQIINKHWEILQINPELRNTFQNSLFVAFKRNEN